MNGIPAMTITISSNDPRSIKAIAIVAEAGQGQAERRRQERRRAGMPLAPMSLQSSLHPLVLTAASLWPSGTTRPCRTSGRRVARLISHGASIEQLKAEMARLMTSDSSAAFSKVMGVLAACPERAMRSAFRPLSRAI